MANDSKIVLTAGLQKQETVNTIANDLKQVSAQLTANKSLKITGNLDLSSTTTRIQSQLATISKNLKLEIPSINFNANTGNVANTTSGVVSSAKQTQTSITGISNTISSEIDKMKEILAQRFGVDARSIITKFTKDSNEALKGFELEVQKTNGAIENFKYSVNTQTGFIKELGTSGTDRGIVQTLANATKEADKLSLKLTGLKATYTDINAAKPIKQDENIQQLETAYGKARAAIEALRNTDAQSYRQLLSNAQAEINGYNNLAKALRNAETVASKLRAKPFDVVKQESLNNLDSFIQKMERMSLTTGVQSLTQEAQALKTALGAVSNPSELVQVEGKISNLKSEFGRLNETAQKGNAFIDLQNKVQLAITSLTQFALQYKNTIETFNGQSNGSTFAQSFQYFMKELESSDMNKARLEQLTQQIRNFESEVKLVDRQLAQNNQAAKNKDKFDIIKQDTLDKLDLFVQKMQQLNIKSGLPVLTQEAEQVRNALSTATTQEGLDTAIRQFDALKVSIANLNGEARNSNAMQTLQNNIIKTQSAIDKFANSNSKAVTSIKQMSDGRTFAQAFSDLKASLSDTSLTENGLKQINQQFQIFKNEAQSAGLVSSSFFSGMASQIKQVTTQWLSLYAVINRVSSAVTELKSIDDILTEISKTSDRTTESLKELGSRSFDAASSYGRKASDYLLGVQEMSRSGFGDNQSEQLSELAIKAQAAGDMTADLANQYIIATNAAYKYEGDIEKLTKTLDSQNYITNHNAVTMTELASATKIAASQAASAGVAIDELTAATGTMMAITQQGGEQSARAFRGILMNIQQVKGDVGDGEDIISEESLTKYQKAAADLGVSLTEVRNRTVTLREPMEVLKDLSVAFSKESENSVKRANLLSAVGGKFRANQLSALLDNWNVYEKMLGEFNSSEAVGSAMEEAEKSANNWSGTLNKVANSWTELISRLINSDEAVNLLKTINSLLQSAGSSDITDGFGTLIKGITEIISVIGELSSTIGTLPTLIGVLSTIKGKGIFGTVIGDTGIASAQLTVFNKSLNELFDNIKANGLKQGIFGTKTSIINDGDVDRVTAYFDILNSTQDKVLAYRSAMSGASTATQQIALTSESAAVAQNRMASAVRGVSVASKAANVATKALGVAMNLAFNIGVTLIISRIVSAITEMSNKQKEQARAAEEAAVKAEELRKSTLATMEQTQEEADRIAELKQEYIQLVSTTSDVTEAKDRLTAIQDTLIEKYGSEAEKLDLVNGKLSENLDILREAESKSGTFSSSESVKGLEDAQAYFDESKYAETVASFNVAARGGSGLSDNMNSAVREAESLYNILRKIIDDRKISDFFDFRDNLEEGIFAPVDTDFTYSFGISLKEGMTPDDALKALRELQSAYDEFLTKTKNNTQYFSEFGDTGNILALKEQVSEYYDIINQANKEQEKQAQISKFNTSEEKARYDELINKANELSKTLNDSKTSPQDLYKTSIEFSELRSQIFEIIKLFPAMQSEAETAFKGMGMSIDEVDFETENFRSQWYEALGEKQKGVFKDVSEIQSAMTKILSGESLSSSEVWSILEKDTDRTVRVMADNSNRLALDYKSLIDLKDELIRKETDSIRKINEEDRAELKLAQDKLKRINVQIQAEMADGASRPSTYLIEQQYKVSKEIKNWQEDIERNHLLIQDLNSSLGETITNEKQIKKLESDIADLRKEADAYEKAFTKSIDNIIDGYQAEQDELNSQLDSLNEQLDALQAQEEQLDKIIDNYKAVSDTVGKVIDEEKSLLESQKEAQEEAYNAQINRLKEQHDQKEADNDLTEKQIQLQEKLKRLEEAKKNKVRVYSEARGWHYEVDRDSVATARNEVNEAQANIDKTLADAQYNAQINALEKERDAAINTYDEQIKAYDDYYENYKSIIESQTEIENEQLAQQILGVDYREKIKNKDTQILNKFKTDFGTYSKQLSNLVNVEIENLNKSIDAKNKEINAIKGQIDEWNSYKNKVTEAINSAKEAQEDYQKFMAGINLNESSTLSDRLSALNSFKTQYSSYLNQIAQMQSQVNDVSATVTVNADVSNARKTIADFLEDMLDAFDKAAKDSSSFFKNIIPTSDKSDDKPKNIADYVRKLRGYSSGGEISYTGLAMVHGTPQSSETAFNASQSRDLWNLVRTGQFTDILASKATNALGKIKSTNSSATSNVTVQQMIIKSDTPEQFHKQFTSEINKYMSVELNNSYTR